MTERNKVVTAAAAKVLFLLRLHVHKVGCLAAASKQVGALGPAFVTLLGLVGPPLGGPGV